MLYDWDKLRIFHAVALAGSLTKAGQMLHLSQSAISRQISDLEAHLNVILFTRHTRGLVLTEQGELLQKATQDMIAKLREAQTLLTENRNEPSGLLRVTATHSIGTMIIAPRLSDFQKKYPKINLSLILDDREYDLAMREADIALRIFPSRLTENLIRRHFLRISLNLYAHPDYLATHGTPEKLSDLDHHALLAFPDEGIHIKENPNWFLSAEVPLGEQRRTHIRVNSFHALVGLVLQKEGIACLPNYFEKSHPELVQVLPHIAVPQNDLFFVYTDVMRHALKVIAFRDYLLDALN